jgi:Na+/phosphate symporter
MFLFSFLVYISVIHDPERLVDRMHNSVQESLEMFTSYANSQRLTEDHRELVEIHKKLENITSQPSKIASSATH